jgi:hypothetical protein
VKAINAANKPAQMTPYEEGAASYAKGIKISKNRYSFGTQAYESWAEGWRDAEFKDNNQKGSDGA